MPKQYDIAAFIKISNTEHINQLQKDGLLYCNAVKYFREKELDTLRKDTREGAIISARINQLSIEMVEGK